LAIRELEPGRVELFIGTDDEAYGGTIRPLSLHLSIYPSRRCVSNQQKMTTFLLDPPIKPMLAKLARRIPKEGDYLIEPKWDGFRALIFRGDSDVYIQSRDERPFDRYFPDVHEACLELLPPGCVVDGEIIIRTDGGLDFDALQLRLHPARSRVEKLAAETPASFVAFDLLAVDGENLMAEPQEKRCARLEDLLQ